MSVSFFFLEFFQGKLWSLLHSRVAALVRLVDLNTREWCHFLLFRNSWFYC